MVCGYKHQTGNFLAVNFAVFSCQVIMQSDAYLHTIFILNSIFIFMCILLPCNNPNFFTLKFISSVFFSYKIKFKYFKKG